MCYNPQDLSTWEKLPINWELAKYIMDHPEEYPPTPPYTAYFVDKPLPRKLPPQSPTTAPE